MTVDSIAEAFQTKLRVAILAVLYGGERDFNTLKDTLKTTDGNLSIQLSRLEEWGYITSRRETEGKKRTVYAATAFGKAMFRDYVDMLSVHIAETDEGKGKETNT